MTAKVLRVGIAGYGVVGKRRGDCVERHPNLKLVAVCDRVFTSDGVLPSGVAHFRTYQQLLQQDLDVLIVCMTNDIAAEATIAGLNLGLHVFCEKPPGRDMSDIANVIVAEKKNPQCRLMYGFNHRYHDSVQDALKIIRSGRYGNIINMRGVYGKSKLITFNQADWRAKREIAGGGVLLDQGIHMVDLMRLIAGEFVDVQSYISNGHWGYNVEDNAYALMRTEQGVVAMLNSSATQWRHQFSLDINMQRGGVILRGILTGSKSYGSETMTLVTADPDRDNGDPKEELFEYNDDPSWDREIAEFTQSVINNEPVQSGTSQDAYQTMKLVYKIYYADPIWRDQFKIENPEVE
ncbi:MAG: Gfo/Idh/MocA family oxidoreductase [Actinomycetota bacterium]|nr:Gfo/Idh/MocA family oxidoreductase [Actinomycetota bacterium]